MSGTLRPVVYDQGDDPQETPSRHAERDRTTFTFTREQRTTLISALVLGALKYAHPDSMLETLEVISPQVAETVREALADKL